MDHIKKYKDFESIDEGIGDLASKALYSLLGTLSVPTIMNINTEAKLKIVQSAIDKYLRGKAEYEILDEARYDIEMPSLLNKVTKERNKAGKRSKEYPTLLIYKESFCKWFRKYNLINFRNKIDIDYLCRKIMEMNSDESEEDQIKRIKLGLKFDNSTGKVIKRSHWETASDEDEDNEDDLYDEIEMYDERLVLEHKFWGKSIPEFLNWIQSKTNKDWVWLDTETTGLRGPQKEQLTQVSAISTKYDFVSNTFTENGSFDKKIKLTDQTKSQFNTSGSRVKWVLSFNHYGQKGVKYFTEDETLSDFHKWVSELHNPMLVIQNASFDMKMLNVRSPQKFDSEVLDTKQVIQFFYLPTLQKLSETQPEFKEIVDKIGTSDRDNGLISSSMGKIGPALGVNMGGYHDALSDCRITIDMFKKIIDFLKEYQDVDISRYQSERISTKRK